ncbi:MAG: putative heme-binding domain-containing protein [Mariniblastus sp.]|jgi:putative heme-binding domain-containing protein
MASWKLFRLTILFVTLAFGLADLASSQTDVDQKVDSKSLDGIRVPDGFEVTLAANDELATNVFSLAVGPQGQTFVAGPGYIKTLIDLDQDGVFESARIFANGPKSGAQGMWFEDGQLWCTGDGALMRFQDLKGDGVTDGAPVRMLSIKTGGEHDAHAIRRGPDGWWYLLAGNSVPALTEYFSGVNSPIKQPRAGFLMRISPDFQTREIVAHGFRNAYDFDFNALGQIFVYDSDGERDISLPWYRPTRLFRMRPGDDAGWLDVGWKRPGEFLDMPPVVGELGRGSPTGVRNCVSKSFPSSYYDSIFVADWTFGRVMVFRRDSKTGEYGRGESFAVANGQFGFAVTDLDFSADGSLLISTGGRGTKGAVYRVRYVGLRASEGGGRKLTEEQAFVLRANSNRLGADELATALENSSVRIRLAALEALVGRRDLLVAGSSNGRETRDRLLSALEKMIVEGNTESRVLACRVAKDLQPSPFGPARTANWPVKSRLLLQVVAGVDQNTARTVIAEIGEQISGADSDCVELARIGQLALGGGGKTTDPMFAGYTARKGLPLAALASTRLADQLAVGLERSSSGESTLWESTREIARLAAMARCNSERLQVALVGLMGQVETSAQQDIHVLNCLSQIIDDRNNRLNSKYESKVAAALLGVTKKIKRDGQNTDRNFYPRLKSMTERLCRRIGIEFSLMVATQMKGDPSQVFLFESLAGPARDTALERFAEFVRSNPSDATAEQLRILADHPAGIYLPLIRTFAKQREMQDAVIRAVASAPVASDVLLLIAGLKSNGLPTVRNSAIGLRRLNSRPQAEEMVGAVAALDRLAWDRPAVGVRDQLVMMLQKKTGQSFGYVTGQNSLIQKPVVAQWVALIRANYPVEFASEFKDDDLLELGARLKTIPWDSGDPTRGKAVYQARQCAQCHDAGNRLGPRLEGITNRFGREDLFRAIVVPSAQVPDRYRAVSVATVDGKFYQGMMVYDSVDGVMLQGASGQMVRINAEDIETRAPAKKSLMPEGLLSDASDQDYADLLAYLQGLKN